MNRRRFSLTAATIALIPGMAIAHQSEATPSASPKHEADQVDSRTRDLTRDLQSISPVTLLETLEVAPVTNEDLVNAASDGQPISVPWADYGDTDLYSSLGGVGIVVGSTDLSSPDTEMLGAYIVYESAEIAYHEFTRKIGDLYTTPMHTSSVAGTNIWMIGSSELTIATWRIANVMMMAMMPAEPGPGSDTVSGIIDHLAEVAAGIEPGT